MRLTAAAAGVADRDRVLRQFRPARARLSPAPRSTDGRAVSGAHRGRGIDRIRTGPGLRRQRRRERLGRVLPPPSCDSPARVPGLHGAAPRQAPDGPRCARRHRLGLVRPERRRTGRRPRRGVAKRPLRPVAHSPVGCGLPGGRRQSQRHGAPQRPVVLLDRSGRDDRGRRRHGRRRRGAVRVIRTRAQSPERARCGASGLPQRPANHGHSRSRATAPNR